jgi:hypothetical protein
MGGQAAPSDGGTCVLRDECSLTSKPHVLNQASEKYLVQHHGALF